MATYLVSGGAGFIAGHLIERLVAEGHTVRAFDVALPMNISPHENYTFSPTYTVEPQPFLELCKDVDAVFHLADRRPSVGMSWEHHRSGPTLTLALLLAAKATGVKQFIYSSSSSVYGDQKVVHVMASPAPVTTAGAAKAASEAYVLAAAGDNFDTRVLRYFHVYGPRQPWAPRGAVIPNFFRAAVVGRAATIYGDGSQVRYFTYVGDAVDANLKALRDSGARRAHNVCGQACTIHDLLQLVSKTTGEPLLSTMQPDASDDLENRLITAPRSLPYVVTPLPTGLAATWPYYKAMFQAKRPLQLVEE
jgi:UDP-glucose 4-epimerase